MKKLHLITLLALSLTVSAQVTVSTISSDFKGSGGLSLDVDGNLYIGDFGDFLGMPDPDGLPNHVMKLDVGLVLTQYATDFVGASGNDFDSNGTLFQSDIRDNAIYKIVGGVRTFVTNTGIAGPVGIVFDSNDNFYVCNCSDGTIRKETPSGVSTLFASGAEFACPNGITVDENDNLYVTNFSNTNIVKIDPSGTTSIIGNTLQGNGHIDYDPNSRNLYIASYSGQQIFYLNLDELNMTVLAGTGVRGNDDGDAASATFSTPNGIAVTDDGDALYVNCAVPLGGTMINPQVIRLISGLNNFFSIEENNSNAINVKAFPNPSGDELWIEADLNETYSDLRIVVRDLNAKKVKEVSDIINYDTHLKISMDISTLTSGNYFYTIYSRSEKLFTGKLIKM